MPSGRCHCGACGYSFEAPPIRASICNCTDCQRCAGAHAVGWLAVRKDGFRVDKGEPSLYRSSPGAERWFCGACGTGLYYINEAVLPGIVDIQIATLDEPDAYPPREQIQCAEARSWAATIHELPRFERFPPG
jgi:hypothetical protein